VSRPVSTIGYLIEPLSVPDASTTAVVTDSTSYLPDEIVEELGIQRVSLYVTLDGEQTRESEISGATYDDF
jgi:fatty acid-binding protein DegV